MARNGVGVYNLPTGQPVVTGTTISSTVFNALTADLANALTTSIATDGQTAMAANLPMGGFKATGLGAGTVAGDAMRFEQTAASGANSDILSTGNNTSTVYTTAGTATAYTITPAPVYAAYAIGMSVMVNFALASGVSPTIAWNGLATPPQLVKENADGTYSNIAATDIPINHRSRITLISTTQALIEKMPPVFSMIRLHTNNGYGSTNTVIKRYSTIAVSQGSDITYADSVTLGASFTINVSGVYAVSMAATGSTNTIAGLSVNSSQTATTIFNINAVNRLNHNVAPGSNVSGVSYTGYFVAGDIIRPHVDNLAALTAAAELFTIVRVG